MTLYYNTIDYLETDSFFRLWPATFTFFLRRPGNNVMVVCLYCKNGDSKILYVYFC